MLQPDLLENIVRSTASSNLIALDKTLAFIYGARASYAAASAGCGCVSERMGHILKDIRAHLPVREGA